jgi:internalin A
MQEASMALQRLQQNLIEVRLKVLEKVREAKEKKLTTLDLSFSYITALPDELFDLRELTTLNLNNNQLRTLPESISRLRKLTTLNLSGIGLSTLPEPITQLSNLTTLNLSGNQLSNLPNSVTKLQNLTALNLNFNRLTTFPESVTRLQNLTTLELRGNKLSSFPEVITRLQNLTRLDLSDNKLSSFPEVITRLQNLTRLDLSNNGLSTLPEAITRLQALGTLLLSGNQLITFPESSERLQKLTILDLSNNGLTSLPESIIQLPNLTQLFLGTRWLLNYWTPRRNQISTLPVSFARLQHLTTLELSGNNITVLPESITQLQKLTTLDLSYNGLSTLLGSVSRLHNLTNLNLDGNKLTTLPESVIRLQKLEGFSVRENPLVSPPLEVAVRGLDAIRQYFHQLDKEGVDQLLEAKLLILGEGGAGKTTFARKLLDANYALKDEISTQGVDVLKWSFQIEGKRNFTANIWDFGGQAIYHSTHQFFLTRRSLYVLVADTRKDDTDFYYWLNIAELLSEGSPLLIIKNEKQDRHREINERSLKGQFDGLKDVLATNLESNRGLEQVCEEIKHYLRRLPHIGTPLPKTWVRVREKLEKDPRDYISLDEYLSICKANGFVEAKDALQLSGYLNDIGVFLHFQDEPLLKRIVILNPKWGTDAVYKVLDNKTVIRNFGRFNRHELETIWSEPEYESMRAELLQLMMKFKLCYEIPTQKDNFIAPQLLTENQPEYEWESHNNLLLRYSYEFMPKGILTQFIVIMHPYIRDQRIVWKSGLLIEKENTYAEVIEHYGKREIHVRVAGPQARDLLTIIRHEFKGIHDTYKRLKYDELVRCNCSTCKDSQEPHFFAVAKLLEMRADNQLEIQCQRKPYEMVNVMRLLGDTIDFNKSLEKDIRASIFVQTNGDFVLGEKTMSEIKQNIQNSTIHGSVIAAESIKDSFNVIEKADIKDDLKEQLKLLTQAVNTMIKELPKESAEETAEYMKVLAEQAVKEKPNPKWYNVSIEGLIAAAQNLGKVGDAVIELTGKVRKILTGGL